MTLPTIQRLLSDGHGDRHIASTLGVTRHRARVLMREAERAPPIAASAPGSELLRYDAACRAVAEARTFDEVRSWEDKAAAVREYGRRIRNRSIEIDAI